MALWSNYASVVVSLSVLDLNSVSLLLTSAWNIKAPANWTAAENSPQYFKTLSPDGGGIISFFNVELTEVTAVHVSDTLHLVQCPLSSCHSAWRLKTALFSLTETQTREKHKHVER